MLNGHRYSNFLLLCTKKPDEINGGGGEQRLPEEPAEGGEQQVPGEPAEGEEHQAPTEPAVGQCRSVGRGRGGPGPPNKNFPEEHSPGLPKTS